MKNILILLIVLISLILAVPASAQNVSTGISIADGELRSFYLAIGDYYRVPEPRVVHVKKHYRVRDEELPVVFYLASCARVEPMSLLIFGFGKG